MLTLCQILKLEVVHNRSIVLHLVDIMYAISIIQYYNVPWVSRKEVAHTIFQPFEQLKQLNPLTAGAACILVFIFYKHITYHILNMLKIQCDINQQDLKRVDLHFVKSE